jgi:hypothetical protein
LRVGGLMTEDKRESAVYGLVREFSTFCLYSCVAALAFIGLVAVLGLISCRPCIRYFKKQQPS